MTYDATWESVATHPLPEWFDDAKLGVFVHWGIYSVPGWAPQVPDIQSMLVRDGPRRMLRENPYAEWYRNSMALKGSPTWRHHRETYGETFAYDDFIPAFNQGTATCDVDAIAQLAQRAGAGYVVLTTKHHDGFALWPSAVPHPTKGRYHADRDLVGELTRAVRGRGLRMGLYYSGGYDWPYNGAVLRRAADAVLAAPVDAAYATFALAHWRELIDRYEPSVLWNDIGWPDTRALPALFSEFYNRVPDGVVNDRWTASLRNRGPLQVAVVRGGGALLEASWRLLPAHRKRLVFSGAKWADFTTPEYESFDAPRTKKWETVRGIGHSFGANRNERPEDLLSGDELIRLLCRVVAAGGNLMIGVGPDDRGAIPADQAAPLSALGEWMDAHHPAIHQSRPWRPAEPPPADAAVCFTAAGGTRYALLLDGGQSRQCHFGTWSEVPTTATLLANGARLDLDTTDHAVTVRLPDGAPAQAVHAVALTLP